MNKMSEDEAIKILRDIPFFEQVENHDVEGPRWILRTNKRLVQARDMVLDLYKQEKEKNKELNEKLKMSIAMLTKGTYPETEKGANDFDNYFISKDKIRAKIKELEEKSEYWNCDEIQVLKDLLEEG